MLSSKEQPVTTGAHSHYFAEWVAATLAVQVPQRSSVSVVRFDVHDLERVNGSFGHRVGDAVLRIVSTAESVQA